VVIGILIALGINNLNENRKNTNQEKIVITKLHEDLTTDSAQFIYYKQQFELVDQLHLELYNLAQGKQPIDSISELLLIRRTLYFKQLVGSNFKETIREIDHPKIDEALSKNSIGSINCLNFSSLIVRTSLTF